MGIGAFIHKSREVYTLGDEPFARPASSFEQGEHESDESYKQRMDSITYNQLKTLLNYEDPDLRDIEFILRFEQEHGLEEKSILTLSQKNRGKEELGLTPTTETGQGTVEPAIKKEIKLG